MSGLALALWAARTTLAGPRFVFLWWNLFLAWVPWLLSASLRFTRRGLFFWPLVLGWLAFFPNAPYLLTDILHLQPRADAPFWFDLLLLLAFAWTGVFLGLVSLFLMQALVRRAAGAAASWAVALGVLGVSGFGIYLGRFLRWNSWDVFFSPASLLLDILAQLRHPLLNARTFVFSALFSLFLISAYLMVVALIHMQVEALPAADELP